MTEYQAILWSRGSAVFIDSRFETMPDEAHLECFIANPVQTEVRSDPVAG
jgi:hypothetical protein